MIVSFGLAAAFGSVVFWLVVTWLRSSKINFYLFIFKKFDLGSWLERNFRRWSAGQRRAIERDLPQVIHLFCLEISAGNNLAMAMAGVASVIDGSWSQELTKILVRHNMGISLNESLLISAEALRSPDFSHFVLALRQAEALGVSLTEMLTMEAKLLTSKRRREAEELARKASVKISAPLVLCIFPALLIVYLMPVIINLLETL